MAMCTLCFIQSMIDSKTNELIALAPNLDLVDFLKMESMPTTSTFLKKVGDYINEL